MPKIAILVIIKARNLPVRVIPLADESALDATLSRVWKPGRVAHVYRIASKQKVRASVSKGIWEAK